MRWFAVQIMLFAVAVTSTSAGVTFLGPTPYLSKADSPFPVDGSNPNFFLEDFEDGELNTPGISQRNLFPLFGDGALAVVRGPSIETDSVDEDDGVIDGLGRSGHSLRSSLDLIVDTLPPIHSFEIAFDFDELELGYHPTAFGVVWTDGLENSSFSLRVTTSLGNSFSSDSIVGIGDESRDGGTSEDFFIGVTAKAGISSVLVRGGYLGNLSTAAAIEIDHVQYGLVVPEPNTLLFALAGVGGFLYQITTRASEGTHVTVPASHCWVSQQWQPVPGTLEGWNTPVICKIFFPRALPLRYFD